MYKYNYMNNEHIEKLLFLIQYFIDFVTVIFFIYHANYNFFYYHKKKFLYPLKI